MAARVKRSEPTEKPERGRGRPSPVQTNLAVSKDLADQIRAIVKDTGATTYEVTNRIIQYGLENGEFDFEIRTVKWKPRHKK